MLQAQAGGQQGAAAAPMVETSLLSGIALLGDLSETELTALEQACRYRRFAAHEHVIERDSQNHDVFFVVRGRVRIVNYSVQGREITFGEVGEGGYFGELSALDGKPRSAGVMAIEDSLIVAVPGALFMQVLEKHPEMSVSVMKHLADLVRTGVDRIMDLSTLAAHNRVHAELLRQASTQMTNSNAAHIEPIPVHSNLASRVSTTRETVARVLNDLARQGIVERTRNALLIHNVDRLRNIVQEVRG